MVAVIKQVRHVIPISGKDSLCAALIQTARHPDLPYEFFFNDTKVELPETYTWLERVEQVKGWKIKRIGRDLREIIREEDMLPSHGVRFCTRRAKIEGMEEEYGASNVVVYYGLRADENRVGRRPSDGWTHVYPLVEAGIDLRGVWIILKNQDLLPPAFFWPSLYYRVLEMLGSRAHLVEQLEEWEFQMLFAGRTRANCAFCFYQRPYEILWQSETHPELLWQTSWMERTTGRKRQGRFSYIDNYLPLFDEASSGRTASYSYSFRDGYFFDEIVERRKEILDRRAGAVCRAIGKRFECGLLGVALDSEIAMTSCGLLCGK
ncbi:MAG TPA: phosphoadenosine phosphosulfate reductase family protein [Pyrinomonadaceae bacterium]|nr:phosphoadenosine phosphosulfate reductase family protein [Pyrinomonadaceae bacterium]